MSQLYIAYGSNLNLRQMAHRCPTAKVAGKAMLTDYEMLFRGGIRSSVATVEPMPGGRVPVLLWDIKPKDEKALDVYEGWPRLYRKEDMTVELNGRPVSAMVYVMNEGHILGTPSQSYYNTLLEGYFHAEFDRQILDDAVQQSAVRYEEQIQQQYQQHQQNFWDMGGW